MIIENWNVNRFIVHTRRHEELTDIVERRTTEILQRLKHRGWLKEFNEYNVTYEWNGSCHCHPSYEQTTFPSEWIFADDWEKQVDVVLAKQEAKRRADDAANQAIKERQERQQLETLQQKYK